MDEKSKEEKEKNEWEKEESNMVWPDGIRNGPDFFIFSAEWGYFFGGQFFCRADSWFSSYRLADYSGYGAWHWNKCPQMGPYLCVYGSGDYQLHVGWYLALWRMETGRDCGSDLLPLFGIG